jgi:hypothetical protein
MGIARWMQNYPHLLERAFQLNNWIFKRLKPVMQRLGFERVDRWLRLPEELSKKAIFDCRMCGQCVLHSTGMTCPMTCPKFIRNGPCGGVRPNGHCEVLPEMRCVWVDAYVRSQEMPTFGPEMLHLQPPVNHRLGGSSAWVNTLTGKDNDFPSGWIKATDIPILSD